MGHEEMTVVEMVQEFAVEDGLRKRERYFYQDELPFAIPEGKVVRVTIDYVSLAKLENRPEP